MTRDASRSPPRVQPSSSRDGDLLAFLWEEAPFARLPTDAPSELQDLVQDIENPKRVYAIHRASRRHNFQLLIERYVLQLRYGCESDACTTPTCFTCRNRITGKTPIRRFNTTSARTLAVFLASQDSPEAGLCPHLTTAKDAPAAVGALIFSSKQHPRQQFNDPFVKLPGLRDAKKRRAGSGCSSSSAEPARSGSQPTDSNEQQRPSNNRGDRKSHFDSATGEVHSGVKVTERPASKDHRSFAANVFGTVAFKMLEWLTPSSLAAMSQKIDALDAREVTSQPEDGPERPAASPTPPHRTPSPKPQRAQPALGDMTDQETLLASDRKGTTDVTVPAIPLNSAPPGKGRHKPNARVRATSAANAKRRISLEPIPTPTFSEETPAPAAMTSPRLNGFATEKSRLPKASAKARAPSDTSSAPPHDDHVPPQQPNIAMVEDVLPDETPTTAPGVNPWTADQVQAAPVAKGSATMSARGLPGPHVDTLATDDDCDLDGFLPQSLTRLSIEIVDLVCDILQDDGTTEQHAFEPSHVSGSNVGLVERMPPMQRRGRHQAPYPVRMKKQWEMFIQQSLFNILSDPQKLISSFLKDGELIDSHSLWYCMLRLTRVAPSLVFDSLWIAAGSLFGTPKMLQSRRSSAGQVSRQPERCLTNLEAGQLISICLHALIAAAPLVSDSRILADMSKIRSSGLTLAGGGSVARQPAGLCLQYEDAFSDDLALRLAKRLFSAMSARQYFAEMAALSDPMKNANDLDGLHPLLSQLDLLSIDSAPSLEFAPAEKAAHETRASTLLLDWAKTVMLQQWRGEPVVPYNSAFGGALALMRTMYDRRQSLLLSETQFRVDYFADRLDSINMPVAWLAHASSKHKKHLLDFPFIFNSATLVSYFRSINFLRMSRAYEESSSLQTRMKAIVTPGGLITDAHHRIVLQDLLKTASSKFLILEISRKHVVRDAFDQLWRRQKRELLRPLKVHLGEDDGEEGFDSGGVQQEFFRLAISECLNPDFGAFTVDERTRMAWFVPGSVVPVWKFEILGLLISLAVYNGLTLPVTFPKALYRRLLDQPVNELHHIADGWPDLASGLTTLLEWDEQDGSVDDVFSRTYEFSVSMFDQPISREMNSENPNWPQLSSTTSEPLASGNPDDAPLVTNENRNAYVSDYIRYLTDVSVRPQFEAFARGFGTCLLPKSLSLLSPALLQSLVEGQQDIDIAELRRYTRYVGWDSSHRAIRDFWSIVKRYDANMRRKLLEFVTASDRVPVGGMQNLQFVVQKNGEEDEGGHLPTAYTCYGTLLLPEYKDKDVLRDRLAMALENSQGFGFA
ncbi:ubiquitin-protein ligase E3A [Plectosphaerella plurivora]|uniref:HECT-type E3 ubiquitin transferase n=1 Tax=Plectosphaerella plurivora TaxID=936078 RepID=A0A9P8V8P3_9PEZI|nr:ubiquitin-protein ligase E3A [Plectosphaerella plurivora]